MSSRRRKRASSGTGAADRPRSRPDRVVVAGRAIPRRWLLGGLFLLALALRTLYLAEYSESPHWSLLTLDTRTHDLLAREIAFEDAAADHPFFRAPLYPHLLATVYSLFRTGLLVPRLLNILCGALSCVLLYLIGERLFRPRVALLASLVACLYWVFIYFEGELLLVAVYVFLILLAFHLLLRSGGKPGVLLAVAGLTLGLAAITRPNILAFFPFLLFWLARECRAWGRPLWIRAGVLLVPALVPVLAVTARNLVVGQDRVVIAYQAGINFHIGNNPDSDGHSARPPYYAELIPSAYRQRHRGNVWVHDDVWLGAYYLAERDSGRNLKPSEVQGYWFRKSFDHIGSDPVAYLTLLLKKCYFLLNAYEIPSNKDLYEFIRDGSRLLRALSILDFGVILSLGVLGMVVIPDRGRQLFLLRGFLLIYALTNVAFFINTRYRVPMIPFLLLFAVAFLSWLVREIRGRRIARPALALLAAGGLLLLTHTSWFNLKDPKQRSVLHYNLGTNLARQRQYEAAAHEYMESIRLYPLAPKPYESLSQCLSALGRHDQAAHWAARGVERFPDWSRLRLQLGSAYLQNREWDRAAAELERVVEAEPDLVDAGVELGIAYYEAGALEKAERRFERNLAMAADDRGVHFFSHLHLGLIALRDQRSAAASRSFERALEARPDATAGLELAAVLIRLEELDAAAEVLDRVIRAHPDNATAHELRASIEPDER